jgi:hypothetical protein
VNNERNDFKMLMLEIKKVKKYDHVPGKNESWKFLNLESSYDRYLAHSLVDNFINDYEGCYGLENSIGELYELHDIISNKIECDKIIDLGEWDLFYETFK